jgi:hypothetical protein
MVTRRYDSGKYQKAKMEIGNDFSIGYPFKIFLAFIATGTEKPGDFLAEIRYIKFDPNNPEHVKEAESGGSSSIQVCK